MFSRITYHVSRITFFLIFLLFIPLSIACTPLQSSSPNHLYILDVSDLHLNHYEHCIALTGESGVCDEDSPPPPGKSQTHF